MGNQLLDCRGFTLIEAVLTTVLLGLGLGGSLTLLQTATVSSLENDTRITASQLAHEKIETIIAEKTFRGYAWADNANYPAEILNPPYSSYSRATNITEVDPADLTTPQAGSGIKRVDVTVTWGLENFQSITVSTVVGDYS